MLYGCENWFVEVSEKQSKNVREYGTKKDVWNQEGGKNRRPNKISLWLALGIIVLGRHDCDQSKRIKWAGYVARMGAKGNAYRIFAGAPEAKI